jgi:8-oxo-dGTP pyrophosphatase MutT (NUDIX family)
MNFWTLPGGAIDPNEHPADAAVRECFEETGLLVQPEDLTGVFGGPEFLIHYPNGDVAYYTVIAFRATIVGGSHQPIDGEFSEVCYFSQSECERLNMSASSRVITRVAFANSLRPYFLGPKWPQAAVKRP